ncbi:MAG TPA: acyl-CoA thioesterase [Spirochaetota bacterium]|nr:acyl-CoA thioesterase [Spirochaetota bacterium]HPC42949.1 acyl-CoA thioesterase [Spirochaetota bacterium]HPL18805.1 acyl-CoA thioesterase [Spirochaetota bacterium]HQF07636.1 acyl-CoA thioesterase [Spirochaetota bacterium]HQH96367.1 acyl-CoA thioesterase [Spirochaetota bacterium]
MSFEYPITVRGYEMDSFGHVNNAVYLNYMEQARWEILKKRELFDYFREHGLVLVVTDAMVHYSREAKVFDELVVCTDIERDPPYLVFDQVIRDAASGSVITRGTVKTLLVDSDRIPHDIPDFFLTGR